MTAPAPAPCRRRPKIVRGKEGGRGRKGAGPRRMKEVRSRSRPMMVRVPGCMSLSAHILSFEFGAVLPRQVCPGRTVLLPRMTSR